MEDKEEGEETGKMKRKENEEGKGRGGGIRRRDKQV